MGAIQLTGCLLITPVLVSIQRSSSGPGPHLIECLTTGALNSSNPRGWMRGTGLNGSADQPHCQIQPAGPVWYGCYVQHTLWPGPVYCLQCKYWLQPCALHAAYTCLSPGSGTQCMGLVWGSCYAGICTGLALHAGSGMWGWSMGPIWTDPRSSIQGLSNTGVVYSACPRLALCASFSPCTMCSMNLAGCMRHRQCTGLGPAHIGCSLWVRDPQAALQAGC